MSKDNDTAFLFAITVVFSLSLSIIAVICGDESMKNYGIYKTILSILCVAAVFFSILALLVIIPNWNKPKVEDSIIFIEKSIEDLRFENNTIFLLHENSGCVPEKCTNVIVLKKSLSETDFSSKSNLNIYITQSNTELSMTIMNSPEFKKNKIYLCKGSSIVYAKNEVSKISEKLFN